MLQVPTMRSRRVVTSDGLRPATIRHEEGVIVGVEDGVADDDYGDLLILPGLVDSHVHVNEPGRTHWEGFVTATRAALAGGTTTIVDMPLNSVPPTVTVDALAKKKASAQGSISCDVAFWGGVIPGSVSETRELEDEGVCGFKVFLSDSGVPEFPPVRSLGDIELRTPLLVHAEDPDLLSDPVDGTYAAYLASRPPTAESSAIEGLGGYPGRVHVLHVSSGEGVDAIAGGPDSMSGETCPHYLTFSADDVTDTSFKCAPPIRGREHLEALWEALGDGRLSMIVSDHSPSPPELKRGGFDKAWGGIASVELRLQATWTGAVQRNIGIEKVVEWLATQPAKLAGLHSRKGAIEVGKDADFVVFDPEGSTDVNGARLQQRHPITPYEGRPLRGRVVDTLLGSPARMLRRDA